MLFFNQFRALVECTFSTKIEAIQFNLGGNTRNSTNSFLVLGLTIANSVLTPMNKTTVLRDAIHI